MSDAQPSTSTESIIPTQAAPAPNTGPSRDAARAARPVETTSFRHGSVIAEPDRAASNTTSVRTSAAPRSFTDHQRAMLKSLDEHGDFSGAATTPAASPPANLAAAVQTVGTPAASTPPPAAPSASPAGAPAAAPAPALAATPGPDHQRLVEYNRRLAAENEQLRTSRSAPSLDDRHKALDEIERSATTEPLEAIRRLVALNAGIKDPADPAVDRLMDGIYTEWTGKALKLEMDDGKRAMIGVERNRILMERDKRDREAAAANERKVAEQAAEQAKHAETGRGINAYLDRSKHAERYPLMMKHAQLFDRASPGDLLWSAIRQGITAGEFAADTPDQTLIDHYSKAIETHYQALRDELAGASATSTATPAQATVAATDQNAGAPQAGARTITNASASVAPAGLPTAPTPPATSKPSKMSEDARRRVIAAKHFGSD